MSAEKPKLVVNMADVSRYPKSDGRYRGSSFGPVMFQPRPKREGWIGTEASAAGVKVVPPGARTPLFSAMHSAEEIGYVISGTGEYHAGEASYPVRQGDFLLAPEGMSGHFEVENTGGDELTFVCFQARRHTTNLVRRNWARSVIDAYIERRWAHCTMNWEGYEFDGHVLTTFDRGFTMLITYDQFGSIWINGRRLPEEDGESIESYADKIIEIERVLQLEQQRMPEKV